MKLTHSVLFLRHKLQKGFLSRDQAPQEEEMPQMSSFIKKLEVYGNLDVQIIRSTKINKVLKAIIKLNTIPKDEEFKFRDRSMELLSQMNKLLGTAEDADTATAEEKMEPPTNGISKEEEPAVNPTEPSAASPKLGVTPSEPVAVAPIAEAMNAMTEPPKSGVIPAESAEAAPVPIPAPTATEPIQEEPQKPLAAAEPSSEPAPLPVAADATDVTKPTE